MPSWGFILGKRTDDMECSTFKNGKTVTPGKAVYKTLELHTGGWSGNEDIISALEKNDRFYFFFWDESRRGGHYKFEWLVGYEKAKPKKKTKT